MHPERTRLLRALTAALGVLLGCALAAVAARALRPPPRRPAGPGPGPGAEAYGLWALGPCYRAEGSRLRRVTPPGRHARPRADFPVERAPGTRRIVVVGESTGEMLEDAMARLVDAAGCSGRVEVLECSTFGAHPDLAVRRAEEAVAYRPDVLVVAVGHNYRAPRPEPVGLLPRVAGRPPPGPEQGEVPPMARASYEAILRAARPRGIRVVALQLASNLMFRPRSDAAYVASPGRAAAWVRWARRDLAGAVAALSPAADGEAAPRAYERGVFEGQAGDWAAARADLERARDLDACLPGDAPGGCAHRASAQTNAAIAATARAGGASVLDVGAFFAAGAPHGVVGWETIWDYCHPNAAPLTALARATLAAAAPEAAAACRLDAVDFSLRGPAAGPDRADAPFVAAPPRGLALPPDPSRFGWGVFPDNAAWRRLLDGPVAALLRDAPAEAPAVLARFDRERLATLAPEARAAALAAVGAAARDGGRDDLAQWALEAARELAPAAPALIDLALTRLHRGDEAGARADLARAGAVDPAYAPTALVLAAMSR
jgi:hypothetical protein